MGFERKGEQVVGVTLDEAGFVVTSSFGSLLPAVQIEIQIGRTHTLQRGNEYRMGVHLLKSGYRFTMGGGAWGVGGRKGDAEFV